MGERKSRAKEVEWGPNINIPAVLLPKFREALPVGGDVPYLIQIKGPDLFGLMPVVMNVFDPAQFDDSAADRMGAHWLHEVAMALGMRQITLDFRLSAGPIQGNAQTFKYTLSGLFIKKHDGTVLSNFNQLSHGQKRLFGLLWYLGCSPDVLIADELSNGMHWQMVDRVIDAIGDRQCFLAMQDPALLDHMEFESAEDVARAFVSCATAMVDGREQWTWRSFTAEEAEDFYASYRKGWRQVNEILRARGLW